METYFIREKIIKIIRDFFYEREFHEIIPPILSHALPLEPNIRPFATTRKQKGEEEKLYLAMSPERGIKLALAQGMGNCFALGKSFRNYERLGPLHMSEFLMLEWYRKQAGYTEIMSDAELLLRTIDDKMENKLNIKKDPFQRVSLNDLFAEKIGIELDALVKDEQLMRETAKNKGYKTDNATWEELYDQLFVNEIESTFGNEPFFLTDFPSRLSPLCKVQKERPVFAERFELYIKRIEMGNGNTENTDVASIRRVFEREHNLTGMPMDEEFLNALSRLKNYSYAGIGLGIDRLAMMYTDSDMFV